MVGKDRQRQVEKARLARQAARRDEARERARRRNAVLAAVVAVVLVVIGVVFIAQSGDDDTASPSASASPTASPTASPSASGSPASGDCVYTQAEQTEGGKSPDVPPAKPDLGVKAATISLGQGDVDVDLHADKAPCTVNSFASLAEQGYFDKTPCHRVTTEGIFVLQCGDPTGTGGGGPGYQFADENLEGATYPAGTLAMANAGPGTNGSQFFIVYKDTQLPASYTPFGTVTDGLEVVTGIAADGAVDASGKPAPNGDGAPKDPVEIKTVTVESS